MPAQATVATNAMASEQKKMKLLAFIISIVIAPQKSSFIILRTLRGELFRYGLFRATCLKFSGLD
jgi:hypothetical protein